MIRNDTPASRIFDVFNVCFLLCFAALTVVPFIYIIGTSFATQAEISARPFFLIPRTFQLESYKYILSSKTLPRALWVSVWTTLLGTFVSMLLTLTFAYPLAKKHLVGRNPMLILITFTMVFSGGMIPTYLNVRNLGLLNTYWSMILPGAIGTWNLIVVKNFFQALPLELEESAKIDGASDLTVFMRIVLPLSAAVVATFSLFYAVGYWSAFRPALFYIPSKPERWPLQLILRNIVMLSAGRIDDANFDPSLVLPPTESIRNAVIVFATVPILIVYPFLQKHFTKGVMIGAIKG
ncbi:MAG: carbohydrate ABC transporter permease [Treponema sp.]|nr:carbohydrate ABC transporter permease [Treponema sp.]